MSAIPESCDCVWTISLHEDGSRSGSIFIASERCMRHLMHPRTFHEPALTARPEPANVAPLAADFAVPSTWGGMHGPWEWDAESRCIVGPVGQLPTVAVLDEVTQGDAVLMAAAPEMFALLRRAGRRCPYFGHADPTSAEKRIRHDCADDQCRNPKCVTYSECGHVAHDIAAMLDRLEQGLTDASAERES